jgi:hypothetical protein
MPAFAADSNKFDPVRVGSDREDPDAAPWKESKLVIPPCPKDENLIEYYVSAASKAKFYIDKNSIQAGTDDGVVRYTLVIVTSGGAKNVSFEGLQCEQSALKIYATGRADGTWAENPNAEWRLMRRISQNLHQGELARNFFCPNFVPIYTAAEGLNALRRGVHPDAPGQPR